MKSLFRTCLQKTVSYLPVFLLSFLVSLFVYRGTFSLFFLQDDFVWFSEAQKIWQHWSGIFTLKISNFFMPTIYSYFSLSFYLFGTHPLPYYLFNIFLHALNGVLLFVLTKKLTNKKSAAYIALLFFLCLRYPMEGVVWISAVTVLFTAFFLLSAGNMWLLFLQTRKKIYYGLTLLFTILLILTKEWAVLLPIFLVFISYLCYGENHSLNKEKLKETIKLLLPFIVLFFVYGIIEYFVQKHSSPLLQKEHYEFGFHAFKNIFGNLFLTFIPFTDLVKFHSLLLAFVTAAGMFTIFVIEFHTGRKKWYLPLTASFGWMIVSFLPTAFFTWNPYVSRYSYLPAIGAAFAVGYFITHFTPKFRIIRSFTFFLFTFYLLTNIFFIHRVIQTVYLPTHREAQLFTESFSKIQKNAGDSYAFYPPHPIKDFVIPDMLSAFFLIPENRVKIYTFTEPCPPHTTCLQWNTNTKKLDVLSPLL